MAKRRKIQSVDSLIEHIDKQLLRFGHQRQGLAIRDKVLYLAEIFEEVKNLGVSTLAEHGLVARGARERLRLYLIECVSIPVDGIELEVVSGVSEYGRRIRELRVEAGYQIASGASPDPSSGIDLKPDQYLLVSSEPDDDAARRWHVANRIRRSKEGSRARLLEYFKENVGTVVTTEELAYVARKTSEFPRRVRELRTEQGYPIATRFTGRPDLQVGQYVLESTERLMDAHDRRIPETVQKAVYERDANTCRLCGWNRDRWSPADPRILELHHIQFHKDRGSNDEPNLVTLCSKCHDAVHSGEYERELAFLRDQL